MGVGERTTTPITIVPLAERWNGNRWTVERSLAGAFSEGDNHTSLTSVSCVAASRCLAVGYHAMPPGSSTVWAERWQGAHWVRFAPSDRRALSHLSGIFCFSSGRCAAVGGGGSGRREVTLVESAP